MQQVFEGVADPLDTQPVHFVRADAPPILLLHGSSDTMVAASNSTSLAAALSRVGARVQLKIYEGRSHSDLAAAFSRLSRDPPPVLADVGSFVARVTALH